MPRSFARSTGKRYAFGQSRPRIPAPILAPPITPPIVTKPTDSEKNINQEKKNIELRRHTSFKSLDSDSGTESFEDSCSLSEESGQELVSSESQDKFSCPECGKCYSTQSNLSRHKQIHRSLSDKKAKTCPDCGKVYVSIPAYSMHVRTHNQNCVCPICNSTFSRPWLLQGHLRTHTGERPYKCQICDKTFADRSNLRAHKQTHSQSKPFECDLCEKRFALKSYLSKHKATVCTKRS